MKKKKPAFKILAVAIAFLFVFAACTPSTTTSPSPSGNPSGNPSSVGTSPSPANPDLAPMDLEVYSVAANFQGDQVGWTAKILKDKFNVTLKIIKQDSAVFAARSADGFLGDIVVLENSDVAPAINSNLIYDFTAEMKSFAAFSEYKEQLDAYNSPIEGVGADKYYAWPTEITNTGVKEFNPLVPGTADCAPTVPWDIFRDAGKPALANLNDLISALKAMQELKPENADGQKAYGITLWNSWDNFVMENANQITKWYGQQIVNDNSSIMLDTDNNMIDLISDQSAYKKILQFFFDANQAGIVDPESREQTWDDVADKFRTKRAYLIWNHWQQGFWNTTERGAAGENYIMAPIADMKIIQPGDSYFGTGRAFACGTNDADKKARVAMVLDWMSSPEGLDSIHAGIKDLTYTVKADGKYDQTVYGEGSIGGNPDVPEEFGGGKFADGMLQVNQWMVSAVALNPTTKDSYDPRSWTSTVEKLMPGTRTEWKENYGADDPVSYLKSKNQLGIVANVNIILKSDTTEISALRTSCGAKIKDASWKMSFAKDQAEFDSIWATLKTDLEGLGWATLTNFDKEKLQPLVDERNRLK